MAHSQDTAIAASGIPVQRARKSTAEVTAVVLSALADGALTLAQLRKRAAQDAISEGSLQRALRGLIEDGRVGRVRRGVYEINGTDVAEVDQPQPAEPPAATNEPSSAEPAVIAAPIVPAARSIPPRRRVRAHPAAVSPQSAPRRTAPKAPPKTAASAPEIEPASPIQSGAVGGPAAATTSESDVDVAAHDPKSQGAVAAPDESAVLLPDESAVLVSPSPIAPEPQLPPRPAPPVAARQVSPPSAVRESVVDSTAPTEPTTNERGRWDSNRRFLAWSGTFVLWALVVGVVLIALPGIVGLIGVLIVTLGIGYGFQQLVVPHLRRPARPSRTSPGSAPRSLAAIGLR